MGPNRLLATRHLQDKSGGLTSVQHPSPCLSKSPKLCPWSVTLALGFPPSSWARVPLRLTAKATVTQRDEKGMRSHNWVMEEAYCLRPRRGCHPGPWGSGTSPQHPAAPRSGLGNEVNTPVIISSEDFYFLETSSCQNHP